jgi:hypothetical protein
MLLTAVHVAFNLKQAWLHAHTAAATTAAAAGMHSSATIQ